MHPCADRGLPVAKGGIIRLVFRRYSTKVQDEDSLHMDEAWRESTPNAIRMFMTAAALHTRADCFTTVPIESTRSGTS